MAGTDVEGGSGRRAGEPLEERFGAADGRSQRQSKTENLQQGSRGFQGVRLGRFDGSHDSVSVSGGGTALGGTQSNQQGGQENVANPQRGTGSADAGRSGRADEARNAGSAGRMASFSATNDALGTGNAQRSKQTAPGVDSFEEVQSR